MKARTCHLTMPLVALLAWVGAPALFALLSCPPSVLPTLQTLPLACMHKEKQALVGEQFFVQVEHCAETLSCLTLEGGRTGICSPRSSELHVHKELRSGRGIAMILCPNPYDLLIWRYFPCTDDSFGDMQWAYHWEGNKI